MWGHNFDRGTNLIDVYVAYVRSKLDEADCDHRIETVRGVGYRYVPPENVQSPVPSDRPAISIDYADASMNANPSPFCRGRRDVPAPTRDDDWQRAWP